MLFAPSLPTATLGLLTGVFSAGYWPGRALERPWARSLEPPGPALRRQRCPSSAHGLSLLQPRHCQPRAVSEPESTQALQQHEGQEGSGAVAREQHWEHQGLLLLGTAAVPALICPQLCTQTLLLQLQRREQKGHLCWKLCWQIL